MTTTHTDRKSAREAWLADRLAGADFALTLRADGRNRTGADVHTVHRASCPVLRRTTAAIHPVGPDHTFKTVRALTETGAKLCGRCHPEDA